MMTLRKNTPIGVRPVAGVADSERLDTATATTQTPFGARSATAPGE